MFHAWLAILRLHEAEGFVELVQQSGIGQTHTVSQLYTERLHTGWLFGHVHVQQAEVEEIGTHQLRIHGETHNP